MSLLFEEADRPDARTICTFAAGSRGFAVSHGPDGDNDNEVELLTDGLTFDLRGLAPGNCEIIGLHAHLSDLPARFNPFRYSPLTLMPGAHLSGGKAMAPVVRGQMALAAQLCGLPGIAAIGWLPARTLSGPLQFRDSITNWLEGDLFPSLELTALLKVPDGGMQSEGLAFFTGQELRIEPDLASDPAYAARIALRLLHELVTRGPVFQRERAIGPAGENLWLEPSPNRRFVRVRGS